MGLNFPICTQNTSLIINRDVFSILFVLNRIVLCVKIYNITKEK